MIQAVLLFTSLVSTAFAGKCCHTIPDNPNVPPTTCAIWGTTDRCENHTYLSDEWCYDKDLDNVEERAHCANKCCIEPDNHTQPVIHPTRCDYWLGEQEEGYQCAEGLDLTVPLNTSQWCYDQNKTMVNGSYWCEYRCCMKEKEPDHPTYHPIDCLTYWGSEENTYQCPSGTIEWESNEWCYEDSTDEDDANKCFSKCCCEPHTTTTEHTSTDSGRVTCDAFWEHDLCGSFKCGEDEKPVYSDEICELNGDDYDDDSCKVMCCEPVVIPSHVYDYYEEGEE
eukprot:Pgem_evm1s4098